jgi:hypothetical protein
MVEHAIERNALERDEYPFKNKQKNTTTKKKKKKREKRVEYPVPHVGSFYP